MTTIRINVIWGNNEGSIADKDRPNNILGFATSEGRAIIAATAATPVASANSNSFL